MATLKTESLCPWKVRALCAVAKRGKVSQRAAGQHKARFWCKITQPRFLRRLLRAGRQKQRQKRAAAAQNLSHCHAHLACKLIMKLSWHPGQFPTAGCLLPPGADPPDLTILVIIIRNPCTASYTRQPQSLYRRSTSFLWIEGAPPARDGRVGRRIKVAVLGCPERLGFVFGCRNLWFGLRLAPLPEVPERRKFCVPRAVGA